MKPLLLALLLLSFAIRDSSFAASPVPSLELPGSGTDSAAIDYEKLRG